MNIRYPIYEGVYRILTNKSHKVKYVLLFFCLKIVPRQNYQVICLSRPNAVHLQRM